jgi:hypothetical protein
MTEIMGERSCILALVGELVTRRMPQHVRMNWKRKLSGYASTLDHSQEPRRCAVFGLLYVGVASVIFDLTCVGAVLACRETDSSTV